MKIGASILALTFAAILTAGCACCAAEDRSREKVEEDETIVVGIDGDFRPFTFIDEDGNSSGFDVESARWIADEMGFEVIFKPVVWDQIIAALLAGDLDMIYSGMSITEERRETLSFSIPYWTVNQSMAVRRNSSMTIEDLLSGDATIGTQRGSTASGWLEENLVASGLPADKIRLYDNITQAVADLMKGDLDFVMHDEPILKRIAADGFIEVIGVVETGEEYCVAVRKEDTELLKTVNEGLDRLMKSPKWQELIEKYGLE